MHVNIPQIEYKPLTVGQVLGYLVSVLGVTFLFGGIWYQFEDLKRNTLTKSEFQLLASSVESIKAERARLIPEFQAYKASQDAAVNAAAAGVMQLKFAIEEAQKDQAALSAIIDTRNDAANQRIDRVVESFGSKLDKIQDDINTIKINAAAAEKRSSLPPGSLPTELTLTSRKPAG